MYNFPSLFHIYGVAVTHSCSLGVLVRILEARVASVKFLPPAGDNKLVVPLHSVLSNVTGQGTRHLVEGTLHPLVRRVFPE